MRIHRITLRNFRGVAERTVEFATDGVTVIEGENEIGKSSIIEALFLLLELPDTSQNERVKSVRPVHTGFNPEISAEISAGNFQFAYEKCYGATAGARHTTLTISKPHHEQLTGMEAHARVTAILHECVDETLWRALRLQQGVALAQEQLLDGSSLGAALTAAAGGVQSGAGENSLYARVTEAYEEFYTAKTGKEKASVAQPLLAAKTAAENVANFEQQMRTLEKDAERCAALTTEHAALIPKTEQQRLHVKELETAWKEIEAEQQRVEQLRLQWELAGKSLTAAEEALKNRELMEKSAEHASSAVAGLEEERRYAAPVAEALAASLADASVQLADARERLGIAQHAQTSRTNDEIYLRDQLDLLLLQERAGQVAEVQGLVYEAEAFLDVTAIDQQAVDDIEAAHIEAAQAAARLESSSPSVRIAALASLTLEIDDGETRELEVGNQLDLTALRTLKLRIGDLAEITISGGKDAVELLDEVDAAHKTLDQLCAAAGTADLSTARSLLQQRQQAESQLQSARKTLQQNLRDLTPESLIAKVDRTRANVAAYPEGRQSALPLPTDLSEAKLMREQAKSELQASEGLLADAKLAHSQIQENVASFKLEDVAVSVKLEGAKTILAGALEALAKARADQADEALQLRVSEAQATAGAASLAYGEATTKLSAADPETGSALLENARGVLARLEQEIHGLEIERAGLRETLRFRGEDGLADRCEIARAESLQVQREAESVRRRADAAKLLFETLSGKRDESLKAYIKPFRDKLESFGHIVFGSSFSVELRDNLQVARRTLDGITLDYEKLSTGAKEQIGVLARLACASIVSAQGGVPLILDDALGWSDSRRLERLGAAFTVGASDCQVIVLTCQPDRYRHIGSATVVQLT